MPIQELEAALLATQLLQASVANVISTISDLDTLLEMVMITRHVQTIIDILKQGLNATEDVACYSAIGIAKLQLRNLRYDATVIQSAIGGSAAAEHTISEINAVISTIMAL